MAGKSISNMTYLASSGTLNLNWVSQLHVRDDSTTAGVLASQAEAIVRTGKHGHNIE